MVIDLVVYIEGFFMNECFFLYIFCVFGVVLFDFAMRLYFPVPYNKTANGG